MRLRSTPTPSLVLALARGGRLLRWHSGASLSRNSLPFKAYISKVRERAIISGKAKQADKTVLRQFYK